MRWHKDRLEYFPHHTIFSENRILCQYAGRSALLLACPKAAALHVPPPQGTKERANAPVGTCSCGGTRNRLQNLRSLFNSVIGESALIIRDSPEQLIGTEKPLDGSFHLLLPSGICFYDVEGEYKCIAAYRVLAKEVIAQPLAVLGAPTSIVCQVSSVLVGNPELEGSIKLISWDLVQKDCIFCHSSTQCWQPRHQSSFSSCCPGHMIQGLQKFE